MTGRGLTLTLSVTACGSSHATCLDSEDAEVALQVCEQRGGAMETSSVTVAITNRTGETIERELAIGRRSVHPSLSIAPGQTVRVDLPPSLAERVTEVRYGTLTGRSAGTWRAPPGIDRVVGP